MGIPKIFLTHSGTGHADDLLAFSMAKILWPDIQLIRSRNFKISSDGVTIDSQSGDNNQTGRFYENGSFVIADVGGVYEPERFIYDHHQPNPPSRQDGLPYSAAGLFFKHHGIDLLRSLHADADDEAIAEAFDSLDRHIFLPTDLTDNSGASYYEPETEIRDFSFSDFIALARPGLLCDFEEIAKTCSLVLRIGMGQYVDASVRGRQLRKLGERCNDQVLAVDSFYPSARRYLESTPVRLLVHPNPEGKWNIRWVKDGVFPFAWRGLTGAGLEKASGIKGAVFCHRSGHLSVADTKDNAVHLAELALRSLELD